MSKEIINNGKEVIDLQIKALKKLKNSINSSFKDAVNAISKCRSKVILCGVGKSGKIASKISATLSSVGTPSFVISANECSHGDLGRLSSDDILIIISNSGNTQELKDLIKFSKINKILLIGIVTNEKSILYKSSNIKIILPNVEEAGYGIVPTSSTTAQLALGDALSIALMNKKKFNKLDFKKFHPAGSLGHKLKTASDVMLIKNKIPFVNENLDMKNSLKILNKKKLGFLAIINDRGLNTGIFTDGDLKRIMQANKFRNDHKIKKFMIKNPYMVEKNMLVSDILYQMNKKKITNVCVYSKENKKKIIGVIHIHNLLKIVK
jgi:arabinose-5-phosphate isomerase